MSDLINIDHYVLIVSNHNIAEFRECLYLRPKNIYLITTNIMTEPAKRLKKQLENDLENTKTYILKNENLNGIYHDKIEDWIKNDFSPITRNWQSTKAVFNMTGGTKILSSLLLQCYDWQEVHYIPHDEKSKTLKVECFTIEQGRLNYTNTIEINDIISPMVAIKLYADDILETTENPCRRSSDSIDLAIMRLQAQTMENSDANNPFKVIAEVFNKIWHGQEDKSQEKLVPWQDFQLDRHIIENFLRRLDGLHEPILEFGDDGVVIPTKNNKNKAAKYWIKWIEGDWFEQLVHQWLIDVGFDKNAIATSVDIKRNKDDNSGETDLLLFYKQSVCFLETKADKNPSQSFADFERQLTSQAQGLGLVKKYLVLTPIIKKQANKNQWEAFERLCKSRSIQIIIAEGPNSFEFFRA